MWSHLAALVLLLLEECRTHTVQDTVQDTVQAWEKYQDECNERMRTEPPLTGVFCNRTFDMYACWGDVPANTTKAEPCPFYLPWHTKVKEGFVFRRCGADGQWVRDDSNRPWRDHAQCESHEPEQSQHETWILSQLRVMYSVGYGISLAALIVAVFILTQLRRLRCTRNLIHCNLFVSFILRGVSLLTRDALLPQHHNMIQGEGDPTNLRTERTLVGCRVAQSITQYCAAANYYWLLVEGLYLHNLLVVLSFSEESVLPHYMLLGWGAPVLFVVPWVVVRQIYENTECWERNDISSHWWIIRSPILLAVLINFFIFLRIIRILVLKLRANQMRRSDRKYRLAKSTLTLIPLLGIHEAMFNLIPEESARGGVRFCKLGVELLFNSLQGLLVAVLYCLCNKEVQAELRRKLHGSLSGGGVSCASRPLHPRKGRPRTAEDLMSDSSETTPPAARTSQC
ncbi:gastric inhibitory polypeptide receptor [Xenopus laevis]|nr:gastric inhibitory polypeptide receptor [Xenopus laevis]